MSNYKLLYINENRMIRLTAEVQDAKYVAKCILIQALKRDGLELNPAGVLELLEGWAEHYTEIHEDNLKHEAAYITDSVADHYIYCNGLHIINSRGNKEVGNKVRENVYQMLVRLLDANLEKAGVKA